MKIFGVDPGTTLVGWGVIEAAHAKTAMLAVGCIDTKTQITPDSKLLYIHQALRKLLIRYRPDAVSVEDLFFATNAKTAISVGQARGVILLTAALLKLPVTSYTPLTVKQTVCGDGNAPKKQVQRMVQLTLKLTQIPKPDDAADALAIALTHAYSYKMKSKIS